MPDPTLRETLDTTISTIEAADTSTTSAAPGGALGNPSAPSGTPGDTITPKPLGTPAEPVVKTPSPSSPSQTPDGKPAVPATPATPGTPKDEGKSPGVVDPAPVPGELKAPGTWSAAAREHWKGIPEEVRKEIVKRESDVGRAFNQVRQARQFTADFDAMVQPFMPFIAAEGATPLQAVKSMMQTGAVLRVGSPQQKAQAVGDIIQNFSIDLQLLEDYILLKRGQTPSGSPAAPSPPAGMSAEVRHILQQELAPVRQWMQSNQQIAQRIDQQIDQEVDQELAEFAGTHEFYSDLKDIMADIVEVGRNRGVNYTLTQAYDAAILHSEPVRRVIEARKTRDSASEAQRIADQARRGAISVPSNPDVRIPVPQTGGSLREQIEASLRQHEGG